MRYSIEKLAPGSYDVLLEGRCIASIVKTGGRRQNVRWIVELLDNLPPDRRPHPFNEIEHVFRSLNEVRAWLGLDGEAEPQEPSHPAMIASEESRLIAA